MALSFAQLDAWLYARLAADVPVGNEPVAFRCPDRLDVPALEAALADLLRRHAAWRTSFAMEDGRPTPVVAPAGPVDLTEVDLRGLPAGEAEARAREDAMRPFDLEHGPLYRLLLVRLEDGHRLYVTAHRTIADRVSLDRLLLPELAALYAARAGGDAPPPELTLQYADFAARQHALAETVEAATQLERWRGRLAGPPATLDPFTDRARPPVRDFRGARHPMALDARLTARLRTAVAESGGDLFTALVSGLAALLQRYAREDDVVVGTLADGRTTPALHGLLGCFDNPIALRLDLGDDPSFRVLLARARDVVREARADGDVPFAHVVEAVRPARDRARHPLFAHVLTLQAHGPAPSAGWTRLPLDLDLGATIYDLHLDLHEEAGGLAGHLAYRTDLFEPATIARLATHYRRLLEAALDDPERPLSRLSLLDEDERHQVVVAWNQTVHPYPAEATVHALVQRQAARAPARVAVVAGEHTLSYGELDHRAEALAARLRAVGVGRGSVVGVAMERSPEAIVAYLGALKAGAAYLPLSVNDPPERAGLRRRRRRGRRHPPPHGYAPARRERAGAGGERCGRAGRARAAPGRERRHARRSRLRHVHVGLDRPAQGRGGDAPGNRSPALRRDGYVRLGPQEVIVQSTALVVRRRRLRDLGARWRTAPASCSTPRSSRLRASSAR